MDRIHVALPLVGMVLMLAGALALPWWLQQFAWWRSCENWLWYRRWTPCTHPVQRFFLYGPAMPANKEAEVWVFACQACGTIFLRDTWGHWEAEAVRVPWWRKRLRLGGRGREE